MRLKNLVDETHTLDQVAYLVQRAGLQHLVHDVDPEELEALARAGDLLDMQRVAGVAKAILHPEEAMSQFDGGASARARTKAEAYATSEAHRGR